MLLPVQQQSRAVTRRFGAHRGPAMRRSHMPPWTAPAPAKGQGPAGARGPPREAAARGPPREAAAAAAAHPANEINGQLAVGGEQARGLVRHVVVHKVLRLAPAHIGRGMPSRFVLGLPCVGVRGSPARTCPTPAHAMPRFPPAVEPQHLPAPRHHSYPGQQCGCARHMRPSMSGSPQ